MSNETITAVPGVAVGHWTDPVALTGVTVIALPEPNVAAAEIRGAAPGSRETALFQPGMRIENIQALVFSGGSAYGLAAADGVMRELEADGRGHQTMAGIVPIVPAAILYDLGIGDGSVRPGPEQGAAAYRAASTEPVAMGNVGAGTGAMVAGWRGRDAWRKGGLGSAATRAAGATVGAIAVVNSVGDVFSLEGEALTGGSHVPEWTAAQPPDPRSNTTLIAVATDMRLGRTELQRVAVRSQDAVAACIRPGHTRYDGDAAFAISCGGAEGDADVAGEAAFAVVGAAIEAAVRAARPAGGVAAIGENE